MQGAVSEHDIDIHYNITSVFVKTNLKHLARRKVDIEWLHEKIPLSSKLITSSCKIHFHPGNPVVTVFKTGALTCMGATSFDIANKKLRQVARYIQKFVYPDIELC